MCTREKMSIKNFYDKQANNYHEKLSKGFLGKLKEAEQKILLRMLNPKNGDTILDLGCGSGYNSVKLKEYGADVLGIDISPEMVKQTKSRGIAAQVADLQDFNLSSKYDKILCAGSLEFCQDLCAVFENTKKHLADNGMVVLIVSRLSFWGVIFKLYHFLHGNDINLFTTIKNRSICR